MISAPSAIFHAWKLRSHTFYDRLDIPYGLFCSEKTTEAINFAFAWGSVYSPGSDPVRPFSRPFVVVQLDTLEMDE